MEFAPDLVISASESYLTLARLSIFVLVSAGFDAAAGDELGECFVTPAGYAHMTHMLAGLAGGRLVVALEVYDFPQLCFLLTLSVREDIISSRLPTLPWL